MADSISLRDATVQEIQLELIRRSSFNGFDGERVVASLLAHRELWTAVLLDRPGYADYSQPRTLLMSGLIKLRDLDQDIWNADTLYILTKTNEDATKFARIAEEEGWAEEIHVYDDVKEIGSAPGAFGPHYGLLSIWWD